jgi:hypothetical protein
MPLPGFSADAEEGGKAMKRERIEDVLDRCVECIIAGEDVEACLRDEVEYAETLAPLLPIVVALRSLGSVDSLALQLEEMRRDYVEPHHNAAVTQFETVIKSQPHRPLRALAHMLGRWRGQSTR